MSAASVYVAKYPCGCDLAVCMDSVSKAGLKEFLAEQLEVGAAVRKIPWSDWQAGKVKFGHVCGAEPKAR